MGVQLYLSNLKMIFWLNDAIFSGDDINALEGLVYQPIVNHVIREMLNDLR